MRFPHKGIAIVLAAILLPGLALGQMAVNQPSTISGVIDSVDVEGGIIKVKVEDLGIVPFHLTAVSELYMSAHHMSTIEAGPGDPVTVNYITLKGMNNIISLVDNKVV